MDFENDYKSYFIFGGICFLCAIMAIVGGVERTGICILATIVFVAMETFYVGMNTQDGIGHGTHMASFIAGVFLSPLFPKKAILVKQSLKIDEVYLTKLYEKSKKGKYELDMLKAADEPELQSAWLETFLEKQVCLECTNGLDSKGKCLHCNTN